MTLSRHNGEQEIEKFSPENSNDKSTEKQNLDQVPLISEVNIVSKSVHQYYDKLFTSSNKLCQNQQLQEEIAKQFQQEKYEHSEEEIDLINYVQDCVNQYLLKYGKTLSANIRFIPSERVSIGPTNRDTNGMFSDGYVYVYLNEKAPKIELAMALFHEIFHAKSYIGIKPDFKGIPDTFKCGLQWSFVQQKGKEKGYKATFFRDINEAITHQLTMDFFEEKLKNHPDYADDIRKYEDKLPLPIYTREREELVKLIDDIYQKNNQLFANRDQIKNLIYAAAIDGQIKPLARLIEATYGKGSFRRLGRDGMRYILNL